MNNIAVSLLHQWKDAKPDDLMDSKLRCVFELPSENDKVVSKSLQMEGVVYRLKWMTSMCTQT